MTSEPVIEDALVGDLLDTPAFQATHNSRHLRFGDTFSCPRCAHTLTVPLHDMREQPFMVVGHVSPKTNMICGAMLIGSYIIKVPPAEIFDDGEQRTLDLDPAYALNPDFELV